MKHIDQKAVCVDLAAPRNLTDYINQDMSSSLVLCLFQTNGVIKRQVA